MVLQVHVTIYGDIFCMWIYGCDIIVNFYMNMFILYVDGVSQSVDDLYVKYIYISIEYKYCVSYMFCRTICDRGSCLGRCLIGNF